MNVKRVERLKYRLYAVTDNRWQKIETLKAQVEAAILGGATMIQLREKNRSIEAFTEIALEVKRVADRFDIPLIINDSVQVAKAVGATGVHIGQGDMSLTDARAILGKDALIGVSVTTLDEAILAEDQGADYLGVGTIFPTLSKDDAQYVTINQLRRICKVVDIPVVAIGGIHQENLQKLSNVGIAGICAISAIFGKEDITQATLDLMNRLKTDLHMTTPHLESVLTIAGSDTIGGAGIQADLKTIEAHGLYGMSVITALTAQNTRGVTAVHEVSGDFIGKQLRAVFDDVVPSAIKIGMLANCEVIDSVVRFFYDCKRQLDEIPIVLDPVMVATSGSKLLSDDALTALTTKLMPMTTLITPNIPEAEILSNVKIDSKEAMIKAAKEIAIYYPGKILIKGGHAIGECDDLLYSDNNVYWFRQKRIESENTHGTGCTLSTAIACGLAAKKSTSEAIKHAKAYVTGALHAELNLGYGPGPLYHGWNRGL